MKDFNQRPKIHVIRQHALVLSLMTCGLAASSFGFLGPASSGTDTNTRVFTEGLNIKLDRSSPAFAALEDAWEQSSPDSSLSSELAASRKVAAISIGPNHADNRGQLAEKIKRANRREQTLIAQERISREASSDAMAQAAAQTLRKFVERFKPTEERARIAAGVDQPLGVGESQEAQTNVTKTISLSDLKISREELMSGLLLPIAKSDSESVSRLATASARQPDSVPIQRRKAPRAEPPFSPPEWQSGESTVSQDDRRMPAGATPFASTGTTASLTEAPQDASPVRLRQVVLSGTLEFMDGLAIANSMDRVVVYRELDGETIESGAVWLRQGRFEIFLEENLGQLIGELRTPYGDIIGRGSLELSRVPVRILGQRRIDGVALKISPVIQGLAGRVSAPAPNDGLKDSKFVPVRGAEVLFRDLPFEAKTNREGRFEETRLLEGSNAIVQTHRPGYWGTLGFAHGGSENPIEVFPNQDGQMIKSLISMSRAANVPNSPSAIIWGRVTQGGRPIAGARVELLTTAEVLQPIYFNAAMVPDASLKSTSPNGLYAFFPVPEGAHAVHAFVNRGESTEPLIFPTEKRMVSRADIETAPTREAKIKVFDAFKTDRPVSADVANPGSVRSVPIDRTGVTAIRYAGGRGLLILDADAGPAYQRTRVALSRDRRTIFMPMVPSEWLDRVRGSLKINPELKSGNIVGFIQGNTPYKIALEERSLLASSRVAYFNSRGELLKQDFGEPGGGFVIFNVPEGFRTITVQPSGSMKIHTSVALVEAQVLSVMSHWIR